ncbi:MAG: hypothetical protein AAGC88_15480 [Bacteroidota bacterium]
MSILHILNGTSTLQIFRKSGLQGEVVVWNEILSEGPMLVDISSEEFRQLRISYLNKVFPDHDYDDMVWGIWELLDSTKDFDEIICWYEYDLFCQVNFMAMIHWLTVNKANTKISLICSGLDEKGNLRGLGEWSPAHYDILFNSRKTIEPSQQSAASRVWECYCSAQHDQLLSMVESSSLPYLKEAIGAHLRRFPWTADGLNEHQRMILSWVAEGEANSERQLVGKCLQNNGYYGFGDLQYFNMVSELAAYINWDEKELSEKGQSALAGQLKAIDLPEKKFGGASTAEFVYDPEINNLVKCQS